jgi:hypothetical protein
MQIDTDQNIDINKLDYNQLIFLQINRIEFTTSKDFLNKREKMLSFRWQVEGLRSLISEELITKDFTEGETKIKTKIEDLFNDTKIPDSEKWIAFFSLVNDYFRLCINLFATQGLLYRKSSIGRINPRKQKQISGTDV